MLCPFLSRTVLRACCIALMLLSRAAVAQEASDQEEADKTSASRLRAVREIMQEIRIDSTAGNERQRLEFKPDPLLRYNDATRRILDSCVFRVGSEGRPVAIVSAELYGREGRQFLLNHEFVALHEPQLRMRRDRFIWEPVEGNLTFQPLAADPPAGNPRLRLVQMRRLADRFSASQNVRGSLIHLRRMAAPLDRYAPSEAANADGGMFAFTWGVNPEALLFIETDGQNWTYGFAPLSSAALEGKLDDEIVWSLTPARDHESRTAAYTSIYRTLTVPDYFDEESEEPAEDGR